MFIPDETNTKPHTSNMVSETISEMPLEKGVSGTTDGGYGTDHNDG